MLSTPAAHFNINPPSVADLHQWLNQFGLNRGFTRPRPQLGGSGGRKACPPPAGAALCRFAFPDLADSARFRLITVGCRNRFWALFSQAWKRDANMRIFISAGEPSGDLHGANLIEALRRGCQRPSSSATAARR